MLLITCLYYRLKLVRLFVLTNLCHLPRLYIVTIAVIKAITDM